MKTKDREMPGYLESMGRGAALGGSLGAAIGMPTGALDGILEYLSKGGKESSALKKFI